MAPFIFFFAEITHTIMKEDSSAGEHPENAVVGGSTPPLLFFRSLYMAYIEKGGSNYAIYTNFNTR